MRIDLRSLAIAAVCAAGAACGGDAESQDSGAFDRQLATIDSMEAAVERINERSDPEAYLDGEKEPAPEVAPAPPAPRPRTVRRDPAPEKDDVAPEVKPAPEIRQAAPPPPAGPVVPAGAELTLILEDEVSTRTHVAGDRVWAHVAYELLAPDGMVLVAEGTRVRGTILESAESASSDDPAILVLDFDRILFPEGEAPIDARVMETELKADERDSGRETATKVAVGAAAGALLGKIIGGDNKDAVKAGAVGAAAGAAVAIGTRAGHAKLEAGSRVVIRLADPVRLVS